MARLTALGIMSGTSCDGVDVVALELLSAARRHEPKLLGHVHRPFPEAVKRDLLRPEALGLPRMAELHFLLPELYAKAALPLASEFHATVCGMHGQTVWHAPAPRKVPCTLQLGSSAVLAQRLGIPVVGDLRGADVALGGQGAPIVPLAHWFFTPKANAPRLVVNFGGICNVTYVAEDMDDVSAYDVGPGMMLSDAFAGETSAGKLSCDRDGRLSSGGRVIDGLVETVARHPFVRRAPPKSTGREEFGRSFFAPLLAAYRHAPAADVAYSLLVATATILARTVDRDSRIARGGLSEVLLSGGGAKNPVLVREIRVRFPTVPVRVARTGVFAPEHHEPAAMALIAARTLAGLPSSLPRVTGASRGALLGHVHYPSGGRQASPQKQRSRTRKHPAPSTPPR